MSTNDQVIQAWAEGREARGGNLTSTGNHLFSYGLRIGGTIESAFAGTIKAVGNFTRKGGAFYSVTTSRHVAKAKGVASWVIEPNKYGAVGTAELLATGTIKD